MGAYYADFGCSLVLLLWFIVFAEVGCYMWGWYNITSIGLGFGFSIACGWVCCRGCCLWMFSVVVRRLLRMILHSGGLDDFGWLL